MVSIKRGNGNKVDARSDPGPRTATWRREYVVERKFSSGSALDDAIGPEFRRSYNRRLSTIQPF